MRIWSRFVIGLPIAFLFSWIAHAAPFAYITNGNSNSVSVIDTATNVVVATIPVGSAPIGVAVNAAGSRVYIGNAGSLNVSVIDAGTNAVIANITIPDMPTAVAIDPAGTRLYVAGLMTSQVYVVGTATNTLVATMAVGDVPVGVAVNPAGTRVYVANNVSNNVTVSDASTGAVVATIPVSMAPQSVTLNPAGTRAYVPCIDGLVWVIDTASNGVAATFTVNGAVAAVAVNPAGSRIYLTNFDAGSVVVVDAATHAHIATVPVGKSPVGIAVHPDGTRVYVANSESNSVSVIDAAANTVVATIAVGLAPLAYGPFIGPASATSTVVEYYHGVFDHYFITWLPNEIAILDAGTQIKGWVRTGASFKAYTSAQPGTSPVCRYYIPPGLGDSHFFGRGTAECTATGLKNPAFYLEDPQFMQMRLPAAGVCPANMTPVYRVFSNRPDANHRYMISRAIRDLMVSMGWLAEGDGPDLVVMCAP